MAYFSHFYHVVFSTKERRPWLEGDLVQRACQYMGGVARNLKSQIILANGTADHVHLAIVVPPMLAEAEIIGKCKANCSRWIHETIPGLKDFAWQDSYASFTVSTLIVPSVKRYIANQQKHHKKMTFQDELLLLLKKHGVEYDERYIWR